MSRGTRSLLFFASTVALIVGLVPATAASAASAVPAAATSSYPAAPIWTAPTRLGPTRPASCSALTTDTTASSTGTDTTQATTGVVPWPPTPSGTDPEDYASYLHTAAGPLLETPSNWSQGGGSWKLTSRRNPDTTVSSNPQELCGVEGNSVDSAWQTTTGAPTTVIASLDSGVEWCDQSVVDKFALNQGALPPPENSDGNDKAVLEAAPNPQIFTDSDPYDLNDSGVFNVAQYVNDPRVAFVASHYGGLYCASGIASQEGYPYTGISPEDLIRTFGTPTLPGGATNPYYYGKESPPGFMEAIAGWNFVDNNNNPVDDVAYGHGTGESEDMAGAADAVGKEVGGCPDCMVLPVRVGTSFIATGNAFGEGVAFSVDSGASLVSEALGAVDMTETSSSAIQYATDHGVPIVGSAADEESEHPNLPSSTSNEIINVNSTTQGTGTQATQTSSLLLNGCTNFGPEISVTVESASCSSEATGKTAGIVGLAETAAAQAVANKTIENYPGLTSATGQPVPLSSNEILQLVTMSADNIDFATAAPNADPPAPANNFTLNESADLSLLGVTASRYPTGPGYSIYTGYGRIDAARIVQRIAAGKIPPEAQISSPSTYQTYPTSGTVAVKGFMAAVRSTGYNWQLDVGAGPAPADSQWKVVSSGNGYGPTTGTIATLNLAKVAALFPGGAAALTGGPTGANGSAAPDKFSFSLRLVVKDGSGQIGMSRATDFIHNDPSIVPALTMSFGSSLDGAVRMAPIGPGGSEVAIVPEADGTINALMANGKELPGWPVRTGSTLNNLEASDEPAYTSGTDPVAVPHGEIIGGVAIGNLANAKGSAQFDDVVATTWSGQIYAWNHKGQLLPGWPVQSNPAYSAPSARNEQNRLLPGFAAAPALADLQSNNTLDVVASSMDRHVYAFEPSGAAAPGWPVLLIDPSKVSSVDPTTNQITFTDPSKVAMGTELFDTPAIGALSGSGAPDVVVASDEEYDEPINASLDSLLEGILSSAGELKTAANARVYAISPLGTAAATSTGPDPDSGAYLPGWPVKVADLDPGLLPTVGDGATASPSLARLGASKALTVITGSTVGPIYEFSANGTSALGTVGGVPKVLSQTPQGVSISNHPTNLSIPALGGTTVAPIGPSSAAASIISATGSLGKLVDEGEPGLQTPNNNSIGAWNATTGKFQPGFPSLMNDLQFISYPVVANVAGAAAGGYVIQGSGLYDLRAYGVNGSVPAGWPKFVGGWVVNSPAVGTVSGLSSTVVMVGTREGQLWTFSTGAPACSNPGPWPQAHHDLQNTSDLSGPQSTTSC